MGVAGIGEGADDLRQGAAVDGAAFGQIRQDEAPLHVTGAVELVGEAALLTAGAFDFTKTLLDLGELAVAEKDENEVHFDLWEPLMMTHLNRFVNQIVLILG